jgi:hypothetical protein
MFYYPKRASLRLFTAAMLATSALMLAGSKRAAGQRAAHRPRQQRAESCRQP